jgi:hypothetical protein
MSARGKTLAKSTTERETRPRPGVEMAYPGERSLRFRAALAGARLARFLSGERDLAGTVADYCRLDQLNDKSDVAEFVIRDLAKYVDAAAARINALRAHRKAYFGFMAKEAPATQEKFLKSLEANRRKTRRAA